MKQLLSLCGLLGALCLLAPTGLAQGGNDCSSATPIAGFGTYAFDNTNATASGIADCNGVPTRKDLWFAWTSPVSGEVRYQTCNTITNFDTRIVVYNDTNCGALQFIACASQSCLGLSQLTFNAIQGQTYLLRVGSRQVGVGGAGAFRIRDEPCPSTNDDNLEDNDDCDTALALTDGTYSNLWVSKEDADWYKFCVPGNGTLTLDVLFVDSTGDIDIFTFDGCAALAGGFGNSTSGDDNEQVVVMNPDPTPLEVILRVELWASDPTEDCNDYTMTVSGAGGDCSGGGIGTNYCTPEVNSTGVPSIISATGSEIVSNNNVQLGAAQLPAFAFAFFITSQVSGFVMNPGGSSGNLCVSGSIGRYIGPGQAQQAGTAGTVSLGIDLTQVPQPLGFVSAAPGETWYFQAWYRDSGPDGATSNFTDGLELMFQ